MRGQPLSSGRASLLPPSPSGRSTRPSTRDVIFPKAASREGISARSRARGDDPSAGTWASAADALATAWGADRDVAQVGTPMTVLPGNDVRIDVSRFDRGLDRDLVQRRVRLGQEGHLGRSWMMAV
jgi:hypothetical protein